MARGISTPSPAPGTGPNPFPAQLSPGPGTQPLQHTLTRPSSGSCHWLRVCLARAGLGRVWARSPFVLQVSS